MGIGFLEGGLDRAAVQALLRRHFEINHEVTPVGSAHVFEPSRLEAPDIRFWSAWDGETLLGVGALKRLCGADGEVKSMHVVPAARRRGVGAAIVARIETAARDEERLTRLLLETGSFDYFAPARALYAACGFVEAPPFGDYEADPNSVFMMKEIARP